MAYFTQDLPSSDNEDVKENLTLDATDQQKIEVPNHDFISESSFIREGQDLNLETPSGETLTVTNYFTQETPPTLEAPNGSILTPQLVNSFLKSGSEYAQGDSLTDESPVGAVEELSGNATITRVDGTTEELTLGTPIYNGDVIETSDNGAVNILFMDETSMAISDNARMAVDNYQYDPSTESGVTNLSVLRGVFVYTSGLIGRDDPDDVLIETPVGSVGIRGTIIAGNINPLGESEITVVEGAIVIKNGAMETTLSQQYESVKISGFNDNIENTGVKDAGDVGKTYGSVSDVVPKLFSSINDNAKESKTSESDSKPSEEVIETQEIIEEVVDEQPVEEQFEDLMMEAPVLDPLQAPVEPSVQDSDINLDKRTKGKLGEYKDNILGRQGEELLYQGTGVNGKTPKFNFNAKPIFENSEAGSVIGEFKVLNIPAGTTFSLSGTNANYFTLSAGANGFTEIQLTAIGESNIGAVDSIFGSGQIDLQATLPNGATLNWGLQPRIADAAVNINGAEGLDYEVTTTSAGLPNKNFDFNNDGNNDVLNTNPGGNSGNGEVNVNLGPLGNVNVTDTGGVGAEGFGTSAEGIGDFNGDGKTDFIVGVPDHDNGGGNQAGAAFIYTGMSTTHEIQGNGPNTTNFGEKLAALGDINGDGLSDVIIGSDGSNEAHVVLGNASLSSTENVNSVGFKITTDGEIVSGNGVGDINGDGYDDFAISVRHGNDMDTYAIFGKGTTFGDLDMTYLENPDNALKIHHAGAGNSSSYPINAAGDVNGDGFDDIRGGSNGNVVIHGKADSAHDVTTGPSNLSATSHNEALVGNNNFFDNGNNDVRMKGGNGNNTFTVSNTSFDKIDGGIGLDTIEVQGSGLDFSNINYEQISGIENLKFATTGGITLNAENIFNMLKSSDNGKLFIKGGASNNINLAKDVGDSASTTLEDVLEHNSPDADVVQRTNKVFGSDTYEHYEIGGYDLYIDTDMGTTVV